MDKIVLRKISGIGIMIITFVTVMFFVIPLQEISAITCPPEICFESDTYTFEDGGPLGIPVIITVNDETKKENGQVEVSITSSVDPNGIQLVLNEITPGVFKNTNLIFMEHNALFSVDDTAIMTLNRGVFPQGCDPGFPPILPPSGNCDPEAIETMGGPSVFPVAFVVSSSNPNELLEPVFTETEEDSGIFTATINFSETTFDPLTNTLLVEKGDVISLVDFEKDFTANGLIIPNPDPSVGAILAELDGSVFASYNPTDEIKMVIGSGPGSGGGGAIRPSLVVDSTPSSSNDGGGGNVHEPPTIGQNKAGTVQHVGRGGIAIDNNQFLVTKSYHQEFELYEMLSGVHTISNIVYCPRGAYTCNYLAVGVTAYDDDVDDKIWWIELVKDFSGKWNNRVFDKTGKIGEPVTSTVQQIDQFRIATSITIPFNTLDTEPLKLWVQVRDTYKGVRNFYFNEGVQFKDADSYPYVETSYEPPLIIEPLCLNENSNHRYSCTFEKVREEETKKAEKTLLEILGKVR